MHQSGPQDFTLRTLVREVLSDSAEADPGAVADKVLASIPREHLVAALAQALRPYVRQVISEERIAHSFTSHLPATSTPFREPSGAGAPTQPRAPGSWKVQAIRDNWQKHLAARIHVGDGRWKFLRDCRYEDLVAAAEERRALAEKNQAWARQYDAWARLLTDHGVEMFGELPVETLMKTLGATE